MQNKKQLGLLAYFAFWDRFAYYGTFTVLILYLTAVLGFKDIKAYSLWGIFAVFGYTLPVLGGIIGDRWLTRRSAMNYGALLFIAGALLLLVAKQSYFIESLSLLLCGSALLKPNIATEVGQLLPDSNGKKDSGYTLYFIGMVLGATLGPAIFGLFVQKQLWYAGYTILAIGACSVLLLNLFMLSSKQLKHSKQQRTYSYTTIAVMIALVSLFLIYANASEYIMSAAVILLTTYLLTTLFKSPEIKKSNLVYLLLLGLYCIPHQMGALEVDGAFNLFIKNHINHTLFGWNIPVLEFSAIEPLFAALVGPILAILWVYLEKRHNLNIKPYIKIALGVTSSLVAYLMLYALSENTTVTHSSFAPWVIIGSNCFIGLGDMLVIPTMMSAISIFSPIKLKGTLMGSWFMMGSMASLLAAFIAQTAGCSTRVTTLDHFHHLFFVICIILAITIVIISVISPILVRLLPVYQNR